MAWRNPIQGHPINISTKLFENRPDTFGEEDFLNFHYSYIRQKSPAPWRPCFSTNQHFLKESNKGSPKEHFSKLFENRPDTFGFLSFLKFLLLFLLVAKIEGILERTLRGCFLWIFNQIGQVVREKKWFKETRGPWWLWIAHLNYTMYCNAKHIKTIILNATSTVLTIFSFIWLSDLYFFYLIWPIFQHGQDIIKTTFWRFNLLKVKMRPPEFEQYFPLLT